jgi:acetyl-CoA carboxylase biotin carboxyl carrier protein
LFEIDKIRQLVDMMIANDLSEISLRDGDTEISLRRPTIAAGGAIPVAAGSTACAIPSLPGDAPSGLPQAPAVEQAAAELLEIKSPMVGTFYSTPDPDSPPFVVVGTPVTQDTVVCIVEAMKVFNEIKAEVDGTIEKIFVKNEQPVEYGQPLFLVRPE